MKNKAQVRRFMRDAVAENRWLFNGDYTMTALAEDAYDAFEPGDGADEMDDARLEEYAELAFEAMDS